MAQVITSKDQLNFSLDNIPSVPVPNHVLMVRPLHYQVDYVINPQMSKNVGKVDETKALEQWKKLRDIFEGLSLKTFVIEDQEGLPDMVFCANQSLPFVDEQGKTHVFMSIMHSDQRKEEVPYVEQWFRQRGYELHFLDENTPASFEGCGDALWHFGKRLLWGGYGFRSSLNAYNTISETFDVPVIALELTDESFYHLDTCLSILNENTALIYPGAFQDDGLTLIHRLFDRVIEAPKQEAKQLFACNACCPDGKNVIIQRDCTTVNKALRDAGFSVHETNTSEFLKSGGSVFCMKQLFWNTADGKRGK